MRVVPQPRVVLAATGRSVGDWGAVGLGSRVVLAATSRSVGGPKWRDVGLGSGGVGVGFF